VISALTMLLIFVCLHLEVHPRLLDRFPADFSYALHLLIGSGSCNGPPIVHGGWDTTKRRGLGSRPARMRNCFRGVSMAFKSMTFVGSFDIKNAS
jgi:hypothetical protein